ncbi:high-affinity iron transporter [uncultured Paraglaciecola sp.]|mgnify:FL=1|uniref:high-affinity iron transporter n=1 Tax=uncultured Paraglaciecola sp. TaxID=1765024 RepID=UPI0030D7CCE3|tara:strand:- start:8556 stop:9314 length:759 start_codon:yes stop_codon:yes gene_type:complete
MLINTVVLFLRDALPIFVLLSMLRVYADTDWRYLLCGLAMGILLSTIVVVNQHTVSQWYQGAGYELLKCATLIAAYLLAARLVTTKGTRFGLLATIIVAIFVVPRSADFSVFVVGFWFQEDALSPILFGTTLGLGICISVAILVDVIFSNLNKPSITRCAFALFIAGQVANVVLLLQQIDWLTDPGPLWNINNVIADESEYGHLLKVLIGYEAAPSSFYLSTLLIALLLPLIIRSVMLSRQRAPHSTSEYQI